MKKSKTNVKVMRQIPNGARILVTNALEQLMRDVFNAVGTAREMAWCRLLSFPFWALKHTEKQTGNAQQPSPTTLVKRQVSKYMALQSLPGSSSIPALKRNSKNVDGGQKLAKAVSSKLSDIDVKGAVRIISSS